jgi:hypothetical protein
MMAAIVAPPGDRSIATMRVCLVSGFAVVFKEAGVDRTRDLGLPVFRVVERATALVLDLALVMGSSKFMRRHPSHYLSPARANPRQGKTPKPAAAAPSHHSNAPNKPESQSFLSKIVAYWIDG